MALLLSSVVGLTAWAAGPASAGPLEPMLERGRGTARERTLGCGAGQECVSFNGGADGTPIDNGRFAGMIRAEEGSGFYVNHRGEDCRAVFGEGRLVALRERNKIRLSFEGSLCQGSSAVIVRATHRITGGSGRFDSARGRGGFTMRIFRDGGDPQVMGMSHRLDGTIRF